MAESRVTSVTVEVLTTSASRARVSAADIEILATPSSEARISSIAVEALASVVEVPEGPAQLNTIIMVLGG